MKQIRVQLNGKTRVAKIERAPSMRFRQSPLIAGFRVTIGKKQRIVVLPLYWTDYFAKRGMPGAKACIADTIVHEFLPAMGKLQ